MKVFPIYYCPPISWFAAVKPETTILLEAHEHYRKQQYFNRMRVKGPNGVLALSIPIAKAPEKSLVNSRKIAYAEDWQKNHWKSLEAGYRSSPYFEFYEDRFAPFYEQKWDSLMEFNLSRCSKSSSNCSNWTSNGSLPKSSRTPNFTMWIIAPSLMPEK